ncbi:MAG: putative portal protein [Prokaryotic dsDNA virus sp.]|nr:MAG: putative portal protein [Prokaryotic dsDNA virus sp.]|tara:strand:- start:2136 stop:3881 length:1746 start_codon:yes stop_codon:yes gene_type:complete
MENNVHILELATYEKPQVIESNNKDWIEYGAKNDYYDWLIARYKNSTTNNAVINNIARLIYGRGLHALNASKKPNEYAMMKAMISPATLRGISLNFKMLGAGYFQILYNKQHTKIISVDYVPTRLIRAGKCNKDGYIDTYYYSDNWDEVRKHPPKKFSAYGTSKNSIEIDCVKFDSVDMKYYTDVDYHGGLPYCVLEEEIADYQINDVQNGFSGTKVVNFNNGIPSDEEQRQISRQVKGKLTGAKGDKVIIAFNSNQEAKTTVEDIPLTDAPQHYEYLSKEAQAKILNAHTVISPMIVGVTNENHGFSSNADEIEMATKVFYNQAIVPFQEAIIDRIEEYLAFNGCSLDIYFRRLNLMDSIEEKQQQKEEVQTQLHNQLQDFINTYGEDDSDEWELIDEREVDYDLEKDFDEQLKSWNLEAHKNNKTTLSKIWDLVSTGSAKPKQSSDLDKEIKEKYFKVRYKYVGDTTNKTRPFCSAMVSANKMYRKEDIVSMENKAVNPGWGPRGADTYSIWLYKGGGNCHHKWIRRTFMSTQKNKQGESIGINKARNFGYKITRTQEPKEVGIKPKDMKNQGFLEPRN